MKSQEKRIDKLKQVLDQLSRGEIVQNRQLKTVLGTEGYARYLDDCREHEQLCEMLEAKPKEITEYERRLKAATFAYSKADNKSQKGRSHTARKMFDRPVKTGVEDSFGLSPDSFPQIITSKSLKNMGGGYLSSKRTIRQVKIDAVQRVLEQLAAPEADDSANVNEQMARLGALMKRAGD